MAGGESPDPSSHRPTDYDQSIEDPVGLDDDDMDFQPDDDDEEDDDDELGFFEMDDGEEVDDDDEDEDMSGADQLEFHDAEDGGPGVSIQFTVDQNNAQGGDGDGEATAPIQISRAQLFRLLARNPQLRNLLSSVSDQSGETDDDDEDDGDMYMTGRRRRRPRGTQDDLPPVPNPRGKELQDCGVFGLSEPYQDRLRQHKKRLARRIMQRELGPSASDVKRENKLLSQDLIPGTVADTIIHYDHRCYSGQFADDGNFFFTCSQDFNVRMYDTSNPADWKHYKTMNYPFGQWTLTDASLSRDNKFIAFSSIRSTVCLASTDPDSSANPYQLDFSDTGGGGGGGRHRRGMMGMGHGRHFGIWSIRFSGDGREIVAGTSEYAVYVYDVEANRSILRIQGHEDDVNAVCFGDSSSPHILYSGSDDSLIKVWDRRSMADSREAGVFMGHTEGITYVDSKGDGRYVLSNGKDQSMKLWDLRMMMGTEKAKDISPHDYMTGFDYRFMSFSDSDYRSHPHDCSVVTFRGHSVLKTLIRCHFSPPGSTDSRYVYSGSEDGSVYVYNLDATLAKKIDVNEATRHTRPRDPALYSGSIDIEDRHGRASWKTCVRDASWHPTAPILAATSWNGYGMSTGTCTIHSWNDGAKEDESDLGMGRRVNDVLGYRDEFYRTTQPAPRTRATRGILSQLVNRADDGDDGSGW